MPGRPGKETRRRAEGATSLRRSLWVSSALHVLCALLVTGITRPHFTPRERLEVIPVDFVSLPAPAPAPVERVRPQEEKKAPEEVVPDPLEPKKRPLPEKPKETKKDQEKTQTRKAKENAPVEKPRPGSADSTQTVRSTLPAIGEGNTLVQMQVEGPITPYAYYLQAVQRKIAGQWDPPAGTEAERSAVVYFKILRDGSIQNDFVEEPAGLRAFDDGALRALHHASPLPPLPTEYPDEWLGVHLRFVYRP